MNESENAGHRDNVAEGSHADPATISSLIADLASHDELIRVRARQSLVAIGRPALTSLLEALADHNKWVRWEAAKALGQIGDPAVAPALVKVLEDDIFDVRWLAAEGLIAVGHEALVPLLQALVEGSDSEWLREGAHHVLHDLAKGDLQVQEVIQPILATLGDIDAPVEVPQAALTALNVLTKGKG